MTSDEIQEAGLITKQTGVSIALVAVFLGAMFVGIREFTTAKDDIAYMKAAQEQTAVKLDRLAERMVTRQDVELIVESKVTAALLGVMREFHNLEGRFDASLEEKKE